MIYKALIDLFSMAYADFCVIFDANLGVEIVPFLYTRSGFRKDFLYINSQ